MAADVHRESLSQSIQYSDYSSGDDAPSQSQTSLKMTVSQETVSQGTDDDSLSSTSSEEERIKTHARKRTTKLIESKLHEITSKLNDTDIIEDKKELELPEIPRTRSRGLSTAEKKVSLASRWQRLVAANSNKNIDQLHESQKPLIRTKRIGSIHENGLQWPALRQKQFHSRTHSRKREDFKGLSPQQIWRKKKEQKLLNQQSQQKPEQAQRLENQKEEERLKQIEAERLKKDRLKQIETQRLEKQKEEERLKQIETERLEKERLNQIEEKRLKQIETQRLEKQKEEARLKRIGTERLKESIALEEVEKRKEEQHSKMKEFVYNHFVYDDEHILKEEYILLYLKEHFAENMNDENVLQSVLIELYGDDVVNEWGYYLCLL